MQQKRCSAEKELELGFHLCHQKQQWFTTLTLPFSDPSSARREAPPIRGLCFLSFPLWIVFVFWSFHLLLSAFDFVDYPFSCLCEVVLFNVGGNVHCLFFLPVIRWMVFVFVFSLGQELKILVLLKRIGWMMLFFLEFRIWHNGFFNYIFVFSFCVLPMLLHTCPSNKKIRKNTDTLRHALWDSLSCFGRGLGFCRFLFMHRKLEKKYFQSSRSGFV